MSDARRLSLGAALTAGSIVFTAVPAAATAPEMPRHFSTVRQHAPATHGSLAIATVPVRAVAPTAAPTMTYQVQSGDTVWAIAQRTGATVSTIISANGLSANALIRPGQVLTIPSAASAGTSSSPAPSAPAATKSVTIKAGDTLSGLARTHGTTVQALMSANGLTNHIIIAGRTLSIPGTGATTSAPTTPTAPAPSAPAATKSVTIKAGDTLSGLARTHGTTVQALMSANGLTNHIIIAGRTLSIPGTGNTTTVPQRVGNTFLHYTYPDHVVAAANVNLDALLKSGVPSRAQMQSQVRETAVSMGLDPALALAVAMKESGFNHASVSPANAIGTMQVIPSSGEWASNLVGYKLNLLNPKDNVVAGVAILRQLVRTSPNLDHAIASYYQGQGSVNRNGMASDTKQYVAGVRSFMTQFGG
ncbi:MAG: LysM peptidoglycan-binding domain-containing protein [Ruaniaceae bacterium]|nr:LysM peptidoglycan-binding domain-containing protein [Ruaniaceae bacterium]